MGNKPSFQFLKLNVAVITYVSGENDKKSFKFICKKKFIFLFGIYSRQRFFDVTFEGLLVLEVYGSPVGH